MSDPLSAPAASRAASRDLRRVRILVAVQEGLSYAAIGRAEGLSRERVRQIVAKALEEGGADSNLDHARVQIARLEPALRLSAQAVGGGDLGAIDRLLRVLDRLDKYCAVEASVTNEYAGSREKLLRKLNTMAERMIAARESGLIDADGRPRPPGFGAALDADQDIDFVDHSDAASSAELDVA